jgi:malonate transporter and related proteins
MLTILQTIAPVFSLILLGYVASRSGYLSQAATHGLPEFVFRIAMPLLLFRTIATAQLPDVPVLSILAAFFSGAAAAWLLAIVLTRLALRRPAADASALGMGSAFSNSVMLGIPLALAHFKSDAAPILALIVAFDTPIMWIMATLHLAVTDPARSHGMMQSLLALARRLATNPIILGTVAGLLAQRLALPLPALADTVITLLGQAAIPGALVSLGLGLSTYGLAGQVGAAGIVTVLKLVVMPAVTFVVASQLLQLPPFTVSVVTLMAALPVGANAYLFAVAYDRAPGAVAGAIALSTPLSVVTLSLLLILLQFQT